MPGFDHSRLKGKIYNAFQRWNDIDIAPADMDATRQAIAADLATAFIEEMQQAKVTVPGAGLTAGGVGVLGQSITGNLS
jgi:hypothetical protein